VRFATEYDSPFASTSVSLLHAENLSVGKVDLTLPCAANRDESLQARENIFLRVWVGALRHALFSTEKNAIHTRIFICACKHQFQH
jgi:hypothetical protein